MTAAKSRFVTADSSIVRIGIDPAQGLIVQLDSGGIRILNAAHSSIINEPYSKA